MYSVIEKRRRSGRIYYVVYCAGRVVLVTYNRTAAMDYLEMNRKGSTAA